jgi:hypothetical protein
MTIIKNLAVLSGGSQNGLISIAAQLADEGQNRSPHQLRAVIAVIEPATVNRNSATGDETVTIRFRSVEVLLAEDLGTAESLVRRALDARSGRQDVPAELEREIREAFREMLGRRSPDDPGEHRAA